MEFHHGSPPIGSKICGEDSASPLWLHVQGDLHGGAGSAIRRRARARRRPAALVARVAALLLRELLGPGEHLLPRGDGGLRPTQVAQTDM